MGQKNHPVPKSQRERKTEIEKKCKNAAVSRLYKYIYVFFFFKKIEIPPSVRLARLWLEVPAKATATTPDAPSDSHANYYYNTQESKNQEKRLRGDRERSIK